MIKRNKFILFLMIVISVSSMAGIFGGKGSGGSIKKIIKILETMQKTQSGMNLEMITIKLKEIEQVANQLKQLENEARNLKQLGQDIKNLNIDSIADIIAKLNNYKVEADRTLTENLTKLDNISKHFSLNQNEFKQGGEWTQKQAKQVEERVEKMRDDVKKIIIKLNEKTQTGYMPTLERVKEIMRLTGDIHDADGIVEVTQALGSLTAYMATIMIDIRELLIDQNQLVANVSAAEETEKDTVKQRQKEEEEENERIHEDLKKLSEKDAKKGLRIDFKKIR
ncbi:hypothetical protein [Fusobacterium gastrosuis]|uniref:hypothetical protein n=1 Tax=Fusobacterium gastrosuis TaxID=1755100 RepID=UPI00297A95B5|nr:hypothetical protein [Fusobacterium sp.]MDD7411234.1 hypothetical protein [Fusobacteriaceae bacterium]MDY2573821.1 hypothetical protein [Fusobacterium necrophorum]MDY5713588.1 hypothetical protein [Fusobacterium gastrosuis]